MTIDDLEFSSPSRQPEDAEEARRARWREYYAANREKRKQSSRASYAKNREKRQAHDKRRDADPIRKAQKLEIHRNWRAKNPQKLREYDIAYRAKHGEKRREYERSYRAKNTDRVREAYARWLAKEKSRDTILNNYQRRRARKAAVANTLTAADRRTLITRSKHCHWCKKPFTKSRRPTHDHVVPISKGGTNTIENSVCACKTCNSRKHARLINPVTGQGILL